MGLLDLLPGFRKMPVPDGFARASHILILGRDVEAEAAADQLLQRIRSGELDFAQAAFQYSCCPTRDQLPAGDLGTFATLSQVPTRLLMGILIEPILRRLLSVSQMAAVEELRSFEGVLALPYEGGDTSAFDDAIFSAPLNEPQLVESSWGFHIICVTERGAGPRFAFARKEVPPTLDTRQASVDSGADVGRSL